MVNLMIGIVIFLVGTILWGKLMVYIAVELKSILGVIFFAIFGGFAWFYGLAMIMQMVD